MEKKEIVVCVRGEACVDVWCVCQREKMSISGWFRKEKLID